MYAQAGQGRGAQQGPGQAGQEQQKQQENRDNSTGSKSDSGAVDADYEVVD